MATTRTCVVSGVAFEVSEADCEFYNKIDVPLPTLCPDERKRRRLAWQNMQGLHRRTCDATGESIISVYSADAKFPVYSCPHWWSDAWSGLDYGREFDFSRPFFEQFADLMNVVPHANLGTAYETLENSEFINYASYLKNCYLVFHTTYCEDCLHSTGLKHCKDTVDCYHVYESELCYECLDCDKCYNLRYSRNCNNCSDSAFLKDCVGCSDCFGCVNLRNKQFYFFNQPCSQKEYAQKLAEVQLGSHTAVEKFAARFPEFAARFPCRAYQGFNNEKVSGDWLYNCQNVTESFSVRGARDCKFCDRIYTNCENCYDVDQFGQNAELIYECECCGVDIYGLRFCMKVRNGSSNVDYSAHCFSSKNLFGCVCLRHQRNCILNKQYSDAEYLELRHKIIAHMKETGEWGSFFPIEFSPFAYNETTAQEYFPLSKDEVLGKGWRWSDVDQQPSGEAVLDIPDAIEDIDDAILEKVLICEQSGRPFKLQKSELAFYRKMGIPIPRCCPDERRRLRTSNRNPRKLYKRSCSASGALIYTTYAPDRPEQVLSEDEFQKAVS